MEAEGRRKEEKGERYPPFYLLTYQMSTMSDCRNIVNGREVDLNVKATDSDVD